MKRKAPAVLQFLVPIIVYNVRQFVEIASYFGKFKWCRSEIAKPLTDLVKHDVPWNWGDGTSGFSEINDWFSGEVIILAMFYAKPKTELHTDVSKYWACKAC